MDYVLGSLSPLKVCAVQSALRALTPTSTLLTVEAASDVSAQPVGRAETLQGAQTRARHAQALRPHAFAIGIENGIRECDGHWEDWAIVVLRSPTGREWFAESAPTPLPLDAVQETARRGFTTTTVGAVLHEWFGSPPNDPHTLLTHGHRSRAALLHETILHLLTTTEFPHEEHA